MGSSYILDPHSESIMEEYRRQRPLMLEIENKITKRLNEYLAETDIVVAAVESRVKSEESLAGKLELVGADDRRPFSLGEGVSDAVQNNFLVERDTYIINSQFHSFSPAHRLQSLDSFGYQSLHYICYIPDMPEGMAGSS